MASITLTEGAEPLRPDGPRYGFRIKFFYGVGSIAFGVKDNGFSVLLLIFYNQALGLDARLAGIAIMIALIVDAMADPLIGYISDHLHTRWGRRHPFMYAASVPVALSYLLLFSTPAGLGQGGLFIYLLAVAILVRFFIALYEIPSSALVAELTQNYDERTSYLSLRFFFGWTGGLTMLVLAFAVFLRSTAAHPNGQLDPSGYRGYGIAASLIMLTAILASSIGTHSAIPWLNRPAITEGRRSLVGGLNSVFRALSSRPSFSALSASTLVSLALGLSYALGPYFFTYYWHLSGSQVSLLISSGFLSAIIALFLAPRLAARYDKRRAAIGVTWFVIILTPVPLLLSVMGLFPANGSVGLMPLLLVFYVVTTALPIVRGTLLASMLADVVEDNEVRTGERSEGVFFAANTFVAKCVSGLGVFGSAAMLTFAAFPAKAIPGTVLPGTLNVLALSYVASIVVLNIAAMGCMMVYGITRSVHADNLAILAARRAGLAPQ